MVKLSGLFYTAKEQNQGRDREHFILAALL